MPNMNRRQFVKGGLGAAAVFGAPALWTAARSERRPVIFGAGEYQYQFDHRWARLPDQYSWQTTHNVAVDSSGLVYVIHEGKRELTDHPSIFVFDDDGKFVRAFGREFQGGGHGLEIRREGSDEFLYVSAYLGLNCIAKLTLDGKPVWKKYAPMESGVYAEDEADNAEKRGPSVWGRDRFMPTNFAFLPDGDLLVADGYGSWFIHRYDKDGNWKSHFGGPGADNGKFNTPHGLWMDARDGESLLCVCDRANNQLQYLTIDGQHRQTFTGYGLPANADIRDELLLIPELLGRMMLVDKFGTPLAVLGDDRARIEADGNHRIRQTPAEWHDGKFVHPHDACFDHDGNIFVAEWVASGRVSKLTRL
jgi:hypothetical protein